MHKMKREDNSGFQQVPAAGLTLSAAPAYDRYFTSPQLGGRSVWLCSMLRPHEHGGRLLRRLWAHGADSERETPLFTHRLGWEETDLEHWLWLIPS